MAFGFSSSSAASASRKRSIAVLTEAMTCALCEQHCAFERCPDSGELVCTSCGAVVEAHDKRHQPFKLPLQMHLYMAADVEGASMLQASNCDAAMDAEEALRRSPILNSATLNGAPQPPSSPLDYGEAMAMEPIDNDAQLLLVKHQRQRVTPAR